MTREKNQGPLEPGGGPSGQGGPAVVGARPALDTAPVLLFDGVCNLCNAVVQWVIRRDPAGRIRFAALDSAGASHALAERAGTFDRQTLPDSLVLLDRQGLHTRSTAAIRLCSYLRFPYSMMTPLLWIPRPLRDFVYDVVARNRYRWFGRLDACMIPTADVASRFLEGPGGEMPVGDTGDARG